MVRRRYPAATFEVAPGQDEADALHLIATVDVEDPDEVLDVVIERVLELQIEEGLPVHLIPHPSPGTGSAGAMLDPTPGQATD